MHHQNRKRPPVIFLAFANDQDAYLDSIKEEGDTIETYLANHEDNGFISVKYKGQTSIENIFNTINRHGKQLTIFHFGGHAYGSGLQLHGALGTQKAYTKGLAQVLGELPNLQLVFLNGCATREQVETLFDQGVKAVIATSVAINDNHARIFAQAFYNALANQKNIEAAFNFAKARIETSRKNFTIEPATKGLKLKRDKKKTLPWSLYYQNDSVLDWTLPIRLPEVEKNAFLTPIPFLTNKNQFIGRSKTLTDIHEQLQKTQPVLLVNGIGGIGKTAVAQAYITDYQNKYDHLAWLTVLDESENNIQNAFVDDMKLINNLGLLQIIEQFKQDEQRTKKVFQLIINALHQKTGNNLLVIDNVNDRNALLEQVTDLEQTGWNVLLTSRATAKVYHIISIDELPESEAIELFYQHYHREKDDTLVQQILKDIDRHTLLTELIAKAGETARLSLADLAHHIKNEGIKAKKLQRKILTGKNNEKLHHPKEAKVFNYIQYIFKNITDLSDTEKAYLRYFSILPLQGHSEAFLAEIFEIEEETEEDFYDTLSDLVKKGWLITDSELYRLHPLIQEAVMEQLKPDVDNCKNIINGVITLLAIDQTKDNPIEKFTLIIFGNTILQFINEENILIAEIYRVIGFILESMGDYSNSATYKEKALSIAKKENNETIIATYQSNLANVYSALGRYEEAAEMLEIALKSDLKNFGQNHPTVAVRQSNLANVYSDLGRYEEAAQMLEIALKSDLKNFGQNHPTVAVRQSNLANVYSDLGRYEEAAQMLEIALKSDLKNFGQNHPNVAVSQNNLGKVYSKSGRYKEALALYNKALNTDLNNYDKNHPTIGTHYNDIGNCHSNLGDYKKAAKYLEQALNNYITNFGNNHPWVAVSQSNLANVYSDLGRYEAAAQMLEIALKSAEKNFGQNHPTVAVRQSNLANVYSDLGRYEEAAEMLEIALKSDLKNFGQNHPNVAVHQSNLANVYSDLGRYEEAAQMLEIALKSDLKNFGQNHPTVAVRQSNLANVYYSQNKKEAAKELFEKAYLLLYQLLGKNHPNTKIVKSLLEQVENELNQ